MNTFLSDGSKKILETSIERLSSLSLNNLSIMPTGLILKKGLQICFYPNERNQSKAVMRKKNIFIIY